MRDIRTAKLADGSASSVAPVPSRAANSAAKRVFDLTVATALLLFIAPLFAVTALAIWVESGGPVLFRQARNGLGGRTFQVYKFRSMKVLEDGAQFKQATRGDPRITHVGAFIRKTSIDELPQLLNVVKGEMSLVGPRPHPIALDAQFQPRIADYGDRFKVKPGITGWAQVCGHRGETREVEHMAARIQHDVEYVRDWSFLMDLRILVKTAIVVPFDQAAF